MMEGRQIHILPVFYRVTSFDHLSQDTADRFAPDLKEVHGLPQELLLCGEAVPLVSYLAEGVEDTAAAPAGIVLTVAHPGGYAVCGLETDTPDVIGKAVGVLLHLVNALLAVLAVDLCREGGAHPVTLKEEHHVLYVLLPLPALAYLGYPLGANSVDFVQTLDIRLDDIDGVGAEAVNDESCELWSYALYQPAPEVLLYAVGRGGHHLLPGRALELLPVFPVDPPFALAQEYRARRNIQQVPHKCHEVIVPLDLHTEYRVAVFRILVCDALDDAADLCHK